MTIGGKLKELRIAKNYTQEEASFLYGCSRQYLNKVENDKVNIGFNAIRKFARLYGIKAETLSKLKGE